MSSTNMEHSKKSSPPKRNEAPTRLHISNIPFRFTESDLQDILKEFGDVVDVQIIYNDKGSKGFGFATFADGEAAKRARQGLSGRVCQGRVLEINPAFARHEPKQKAQHTICHVKRFEHFRCSAEKTAALHFECSKLSYCHADVCNHQPVVLPCLHDHVPRSLTRRTVHPLAIDAREISTMTLADIGRLYTWYYGLSVSDQILSKYLDRMGIPIALARPAYPEQEPLLDIVSESSGYVSQFNPLDTAAHQNPAQQIPIETSHQDTDGMFSPYNGAVMFNDVMLGSCTRDCCQGFSVNEFISPMSLRVNTSSEAYGCIPPLFPEMESSQNPEFLSEDESSRTPMSAYNFVFDNECS